MLTINKHMWMIGCLVLSERIKLFPIATSNRQAIHSRGCNCCTIFVLQAMCFPPFQQLVQNWSALHVF